MAKKIVKVFFVFTCFLFALCAMRYALCGVCYAQAEKVEKLMPPDTELLSQKDDVSDPLVRIRTYKFGTAAAKEKVIGFYERLFKNEGLSELEGYSPEKRSLGPKMAYFFTKPGQLITLNLVAGPENNLNIYYITIHEPDAKAVKNFTQEEPE